jgi:hypothetical protein
MISYEFILRKPGQITVILGSYQRMSVRASETRRRPRNSFV